MSHEWIVSDSAKADIRNQVIWYESNESHGGDALADRWQEQLELALAKLAVGPERHGMAPENGRWHKSMVIRQMLFRPWKSGVGWRVLYTIDEAAKTVIVLQVRHAHRRFLHESGEEDAG